MKNDKTQEYIYVVLIKALSGLGKFVRVFSKYEYTHIAVCLNDRLDDFITFSRKKHYAPFYSGFMHERLDCYAFGDNKKVKMKVLRLPVSPENKLKIQAYISKIENDPNYVFNLYSMATMPVIHGFRIYKAHNCMSFVAKLIELSGAVTMDKKYYRYNIKDIDALLSAYIYKEKYFYKTRVETVNYMDKVSVFQNTCMFLTLNLILIHRLLFNRNLLNTKRRD